jgi:hypothetical protein
MGRWSQANCMGYALGINQWMRVPNWRNQTALESAQWLAKTYKLKLVSRSEMELGKEYIVFRMSSQDFHFIRRDSQGNWRHKPGAMLVRPMSEKQVFADYWQLGSTYYNSVPFIFEV